MNLCYKCKHNQCLINQGMSWCDRGCKEFFIEDASECKEYELSASWDDSNTVVTCTDTNGQLYIDFDKLTKS